eukprot:gene20179-24152_t
MALGVLPGQRLASAVHAEKKVPVPALTEEWFTTLKHLPDPSLLELLGLIVADRLPWMIARDSAAVLALFTSLPDLVFKIKSADPGHLRAALSSSPAATTSSPLAFLYTWDVTPVTPADRPIYIQDDDDAPTALGTEAEQPAPAARATYSHAVDLKLVCRCDPPQQLITLTSGPNAQPHKNQDRSFWLCPRRDKNQHDLGCEAFVWSDDVIHSLCFQARAFQPAQITSLRERNPDVFKVIYPAGKPWLYPSTPHYKPKSAKPTRKTPPSKAHGKTLYEFLSPQ